MDREALIHWNPELPSHYHRAIVPTSLYEVWMDTYYEERTLAEADKNFKRSVERWAALRFPGYKLENFNLITDQVAKELKILPGFYVLVVLIQNSELAHGVKDLWIKADTPKN